ncbi:hypothetical protein AV530_012861 [Patagioenas fasciata monilis]|uniref:Uncharacterized protein n=1 Tax=Patagioenas fasciata monilis TaxID=372326 RepID=A0A1V4J9Q1_PATFA|nr:hypothetical protein AV530_012861 [Patagioenas fasciata monilis]
MSGENENIGKAGTTIRIRGKREQKGPRLWTDALFQMQLCWGEELSWFLPLPQEKLLSPGTHQLSPPSTSEARMKSLQVKQGEKQREKTQTR